MLNIPLSILLVIFSFSHILISYTSKLKPEEEILCINTKGYARLVVVGRNKIEKRPLLMLSPVVEDIKLRQVYQKIITREGTLVLLSFCAFRRKECL
ncbi:MAG: hypothetical protein H9893_08820 [Candidatus Niameybacter stercoravium]|nr:hypothetical protein [Candidatus Niameybacter stercoravium]